MEGVVGKSFEKKIKNFFYCRFWFSMW